MGIFTAPERMLSKEDIPPNTINDSAVKIAISEIIAYSFHEQRLP